MTTVKANSHFVDSDVTRETSGQDDWSSDNFSFGGADPNKIGISTLAELALVGTGGDYPTDGDYELLNNIDASDTINWNGGEGWAGINLIKSGSVPSFDGNYFTISNLFAFTDNPVNAKSFFLSLTGDIAEHAVISNLILADVNITGATFMGGMASQPSRTDFVNCRVTGTVKATTGNVAGGFVGGLSSNQGCTFTRCSFEGTLDIGSDGGASACGLFSGRYWGDAAEPGVFTDCYSAGFMISGASTAVGTSCAGFGGVSIAADPAHIQATNCYAAVDVSGVELTFPGVQVLKGFSHSDITESDLFWDTTIGPATDDAIATGKTTTQMYQQATFTNWDFDTVWEINEGNDYPRHQWLNINPNKIKTGEQHRTTAYPQDLTHLNGQTVQVLGDGSFLGTDVVANGEVTLDDNTTVNHVGIQYDSKLQPMKIDGEVHVKRIRELIPNLFETVGGDYGESEAKLTSMVLLDSGDPLDTDGALHTGHVDLPFDGSYNRQGNLWFTQTEPLPFHILGAGVKLSVENI